MVQRACVSTLLLFLINPAMSVAQPGGQVSAGVALPSGEFGTRASTGWMVHGRMWLPIQQGLYITLGGFYETSAWQPDDASPEQGDQANLTALMGGMTYRSGSPDHPGVVLSWELGRLKHDQYPYRFTVYQLGTGLVVPVSHLVELSATGSWYSALGDTAVAFWSIMAGVRLRFGGQTE